MTVKNNRALAALFNFAPLFICAINLARKKDMSYPQINHRVEIRLLVLRYFQAKMFSLGPILHINKPIFCMFSYILDFITFNFSPDPDLLTFKSRLVLLTNSASIRNINHFFL